jgi:hypothetical protein
LNCLRSIPGHDGIPLKYICLDKDEAEPTPHHDFLDNYVGMAPLIGDAFAIDMAQVHTFLVDFVAGSDIAEDPRPAASKRWPQGI